MRHGNKNNHLGRKKGHVDALLSNLASSLILSKNKRISTTLAKAKALKRYVEPIITKGKTDTTHSRRVVFSYLQNKEAVTTLFRDVAGKIGDRKGGYTRILKTGSRPGDRAEMCLIELVDFNEAMLSSKGAGAEKKAKTTRRGRTRKKAEPKAENQGETNTEEQKSE
ncbi:MAG: 50S ribosomal protein L17 [Bacteroidota bacterium]